MGLLPSRNGASEGWFTLQDEPVLDAIGETGPPGPRPTRGRGLVRLVEPPAQPPHISPSKCPPAVAGVSGVRFTRASPLERCNARAARVLSAIGGSRFGALALSAFVVLLALAVIGLLASRGGSDPVAIQGYKTQIARLTTERDRALGAAAEEGRANATEQTQLDRWRSLVAADQQARGVGRPRAGHNNRAGGGR
jgi:hypothetical protein